MGRFGPYVVNKKGVEGKPDYRSLKGEDNVLTVTLERALELLSEPKKARSNGKSKTALRELGAHPEDGETINIYDGPYGPYIKHGKINVSIPEGQTIEEVSLAKALELLANKTPTQKNTRRKIKSSTTTNPKSDKTSNKKTKTTK
ncbi:DNA topoisomerase I [Richelia intracellularis HM01]|nr:DNA topoisomerase I [Richelia intracellularis HM01]